MANTGKVIVTTLKELYQDDNAPTGSTKNNIMGQSDYIAPYTNTTLCPLTYNTNCPSAAAFTVNGSNVEVELSLPNSVLNNPSLAKVNIKLKNGSTVAKNTIVLFSGVLYNLVTANFSSVASGTYTLEIEYQNSSNVVQKTCSNVATGIVV